jgi:hypothetical protein
MQHVLSNGQREWQDLGAPVCTFTSVKDKLDLYHDDGGFSVAWLDARDGVFRVYTQRLSSAAVPQWTPDGVLVVSTTSDTPGPRIIPDGNGGEYVAWVDRRSDASGQIFAQHLDGNGLVAPGWPADSQQLSTIATGQDQFSIVPTPGGGLVFFHDSRGGKTQIYTRRLENSTPTDLSTVAVPERLILRQNTPNPFNPTTRIAYELPSAAAVELRVFDAAGRAIRDLVSGRYESAGPHAVLWDGRDAFGSDVASGVYYYRLRFGVEAVTRRMVLAR